MQTTPAVPSLKNVVALVVLFLFSVCFIQPSFAEEVDDAPAAKTAIVLASFGSTYEQKADPLVVVADAMKKQFPDTAIFPAYTSMHVLKSLKSKGKNAESLPTVLARLGEEGYTRVVVQSLHITPGKEFMVVQDIASRFNAMPKGISEVLTGLPLVGSDLGAAALAEALVKGLPAERKKDEAVVYVGHGAEEPSGTLAYPALQTYLWNSDPLLFVGTIEGSIDSEAILAHLKQNKVKKVWLVPLLTVAGDHAQNDIFGDEDDSWKSVIEKNGMQCEPVRQGLAAMPEVVALWVENTAAVLKEFEQE